VISHNKPTLISLFIKLQELHKNPDAWELCLEIQETLIKKISYFERRIRQLKTKADLARKALRTRREILLSKDVSMALKTEIQNCLRKVDAYHYSIFVYKCVGDGIAHTYLTKWDIKPLSMKESPGFISGKKGARLERKALRASMKLTKKPMILNDLTNCLRYGDITVPKDGQFLLIEMKSGKTKKLDSRSKRQLEKSQNIRRYLATDYSQNLYNKHGDFLRVDLISKETNHLKKVNRIIEQAMVRGYYWERLEQGLTCFVVKQYDGVLLDKFIARNKPSHENLAVVLTPSDMQGYYPMTLAVRNPSALYGFFEGGLSILFFLDMYTLKSLFRKKDIALETLENDDWFARLTELQPMTTEPKTQMISRHFFYRIFSEFVSLKWFVKEMSHRFREIERVLESLKNVKVL
jgi:hypothetical protein